MAAGDSSFESLDEIGNFSDSGSDYEATLTSTKRKTQAVTGPKLPKRPRHKAALRGSSLSSTSSSIPTPPTPPLQQQSRGRSKQASPRPVTRENEGNRGISAKDIYDAVCSGKSAMVTVVDEWLDSYKQSREAGLLVLINFIVQSCGCKGVVSREMLDSMQNAEIISTLTKEFNEESVNYPLCTPGPELRRFKASLCEFTRVLVRSCRNSLIFDEYLFPSLLALLTGLSDSQVRAFRHTSTLLAMKLMTGLVEVAVIVSVQQQTTQRQYDKENSKRASDRASDGLEELRATISQLRENKEEVSSMMNATFRGVFVHRYRDRLPEIRAACIEELGVWLINDPEDFLNDGCMKYLGWTLHDKQSPVRLQCVRALQAVYQEKEFIGRLELFTSRFKERMLGMVLDKDLDVAVEVVNLLLLIQQLKSVIDSENQVNGTSGNADLLQILITFYMQSEFHEHGAYLVDSLWGVAKSELRDWETMTTVLLQESGLMYEEEGALVELMICALRQAAQASPPVGRTQSKKLLSMKDKKAQEHDRRRLTMHFIPLLPQLLAKYSADAGIVTLLLKAPLYFNLEMYNSVPRLEKHLDQLLFQLCGIVEKHTAVTVLQACATLFSALCSDSYTFSSRSHLAFSQLLDGLTECFSSYLSDMLQGTADDDSVYSAATTLKRIAALSSAKDTTVWKLFDPCLELLKSRIESRDLDKELMVPALKCAAFNLMWAKMNAVNSTPAEEELKRLKKEMRSFCKVCETCLSLNQTEIRDQAFELLCDLLLLYSQTSVCSAPALQTLVLLPSDFLRSEMAAFLVDYVFSDSDDDELNVEEEMKITVLQRKRNQLAGYCKLVIYGVLDLNAATEVFKHYSKYFKDFGDIIKETVSKSKLISPVQSAKTVCLSLQQLFSEMLTEDHSQQDLSEIRELAKKLAMSFGVDLHRVRKPLVALHMDGIHFAFRKPQEEEEPNMNLAFLEILSEFSFKLLRQDRTQLAAYLKSECPSAALSWPSVRMYQCSLEGRSSSKPREKEGGDAASSHDTPAAKRKRTTTQDDKIQRERDGTTRNMKVFQEVSTLMCGSGYSRTVLQCREKLMKMKSSVASSARESLLDSLSFPSNLPTPALTSTALRVGAKQQAAFGATENDEGSGFTEPESEDDFSIGFTMRKVKPAKQCHLSSSQTGTSLDQRDLNSNLTLLSLIEDGEEEEPEIDDYESGSDDESECSLPSTRHTSASVLDELFD
ncbi:cohesin subunit SA-2 isoform X2 [Gymnodraco acuticeps]|uniref:Cohesin subunit SA n=1 Tax=Gymnodraco acuticeps TaxID=8218 RepID=A0A6P8UC16_GYMAC|nr:cohesin subunit SA-2 isoform X2 [Gymnodraco acuticeps]